MSPSSKIMEELTYEAAFTELESIVAALEGESRPLDESIGLFERGQALAKYCSTLLQKAELKVRQLNGDDLADFEGEA
ncbi:MAG: exodeoxyribonuclease VII small subunit [Chloroflexi bacterium]|nr:exodeoxyribonuclease VII small subunit [Chloroflexota bacterium]